MQLGKLKKLQNLSSETHVCLFLFLLFVCKHIHNTHICLEVMVDFWRPPTGGLDALKKLVHYICLCIPTLDFLCGPPSKYFSWSLALFSFQDLRRSCQCGLSRSGLSVSYGTKENMLSGFVFALR